jgi:hypothetical protein
MVESIRWREGETEEESIEDEVTIQIRNRRRNLERGNRDRRGRYVVVYYESIRKVLSTLFQECVNNFTVYMLLF